MKSRQGSVDFAPDVYPLPRSVLPVTEAASTLLWGNSNVSNTTVVRYLTPGYVNAQALTTTKTFRISASFTLRRMQIQLRVATGGANLIVYTLLVNSVPTALVVSMSANSLYGFNFTNSVSVADGDLLDIEVTKPLAIGTAPTQIVCSIDAVSP